MATCPLLRLAYLVAGNFVNTPYDNLHITHIQYDSLSITTMTRYRLHRYIDLVGFGRPRSGRFGTVGCNVHLLKLNLKVHTLRRRF